MTGPHVRCPACNGKRHPEEMVKTDFYHEKVCTRCANNPKLLLELSGRGTI